MSVRQWCVDFQEADKALTTIVERGLFAVEREDVFDSLTHYGSIAELRKSLKESIDKFARDVQSAVEAVPDIEALTGHAEELMPMKAKDTELIIRERTHISRLAPI